MSSHTKGIKRWNFFIHVLSLHTIDRKVVGIFYPYVSSHTKGIKWWEFFYPCVELTHKLAEKWYEFFIPMWAHTQIVRKVVGIFLFIWLTLLYVNFICFFNSLGSKRKNPRASGFFFLMTVTSLVRIYYIKFRKLPRHRHISSV